MSKEELFKWCELEITKIFTTYQESLDAQYKKTMANLKEISNAETMEELEQVRKNIEHAHWGNALGI